MEMFQMESCSEIKSVQFPQMASVLLQCGGKSLFGIFVSSGALSLL